MTEYRRCQGKSYMIISRTKDADGYETKMLSENRIKGLLPLQITDAENGRQYWYEISGRQDLESWANMHSLGSEFLKKLLSALRYTIEKTGQYLLGEEGISLNPKYIFVGSGESEILFCYLPFEKTAFEDSIRTFMEYYLQHMEHGRQEEIQKCYEVYDKCYGAHVSIEELLEVVYKEPAAEELAEEKTAEDELRQEPEEKRTTRLPHWNWNPKLPVSKKKKNLETSYVFEPEELELAEKEPSNPTVFLGSETPEILGELKYEGEGRENNLLIRGDMFLIGNRTGEADGVIHAATVSRIHAKITREEENYYIEDMNSTNGTYRNGELLNYRQKVLLEKNDVVRFADETFRFV